MPQVRHLCASFSRRHEGDRQPCFVFQDPCFLWVPGSRKRSHAKEISSTLAADLAAEVGGAEAFL